MNKKHYLLAAFILWSIPGLTQNLSRWFSYHNARVVENFGNPTYDAHVIFGDTTVRSQAHNSQLMIENYPDQLRVRFHLIGEVFDPFTELFRNFYGLNWDSKKKYTVDSMQMGYIYVRNHPNQNIVDTLLVYVYKGTSMNLFQWNMPDNGGTNTNNYDADTVKMKLTRYNASNNTPNSLGQPMVLYKIPLRSGDVTGPNDMNQTLKWAINDLAIDSGQYLVTAIGFKPGYTYNNGDTISKNKNYFCFVSAEMYGPFTYPHYHEVEFNMSSVITNYERYGQPLLGQPFFVPPYIWASPWQYEHHLISFHVKGHAMTAGTKEFLRGQLSIYPNPASGKVEVANNSEVGFSSLVITDALGRQKLELVNPDSRLLIDVSKWEDGMYFMNAFDGSRWHSAPIIVQQP